MALDWRKIVGTVAPILAKTLAIGNPLAGMAAQALSQTLLGRPDGTEEELSISLAGATPETLLDIKKVEADFKLQMMNAGVDLEKIHAEDRASARSKEERTGDKTPAILAGVFIFSYIIFIVVILWKGVPQEGGTKEVILILTGIMGASITQILNYYFGSSKGSSDKTKMLIGK